ncbi:MAG: tetratricopeptide repeat protein [Planctomycetes bacterium]|nr:tetratricopeptide repeat protein [Planctomycetota bacterium]
MIGTIANNRYQILARLGAGGSGVVYRAADLFEQGREVALKVLIGQAQNPDLIEHFKVEFGVMTRLRHPNLPEVYDFGVLADVGSFFLTCELVRGRDLLTATEGMPVPLLCEIAVQVCRALEYIHSRGLVHYDVKPSNILVSGDGKGRFFAKLLDLGLAAEARTSTGNPLRGTLAYMAPEIARGDPVDRRADLYSLGVTLYQALTERLPFAGGTGAEMLLHHLESVVPPPSSVNPAVPPALDGVLLRLLAKDPADRFPSANHVIGALGDAAGFRFEVETRETRAGYIASSRFVGRSETMETVHAAVRARCDREVVFSLGAAPPMLLLVGERGSGKSRIQRELKYHLQVNQIRHAEGACRPGAKGLFAPWAELLRQLLVQSSPEDPEVASAGAELVKLVPDLAERVTVRRSPPLDPERERLRIMGKVTEYLTAVARRGPLVLWLDNVQAADEATAELLHFLVRYLAYQNRSRQRPRSDTTLLTAPARLLLCASRSSDEPAAPETARLLASLRDEGYLQELVLRPLASEDVALLLESMLGVPSVPRAFAERITRESGGNPFFIEEIMKGLAEEGHPLVRGGEWAIRPEELDKIRLPSSIAEALRDRLARLESVSVPVLQVLSLAELPMPTHWIARAGGLTLSAAVSLLASLSARGLVQRERLGQVNLYALTSQNLKSLLSDSMQEAERQALHLRLASLIEEDTRTPLEERVEALAYHYTQSGSFDKCIQYAEQAAERAARLGFRARAQETVSFAIEALETKAAIGRKLDEQERRKASGLYRRRAKFTMEAGHGGEALPDLERARDLAREGKDAEGEAEALLLQASIARGQGRPAETRQAVEAAHALGQKRDLPGILARAQTILGQLAFDEGSYPVAVKLFREALRRFEVFGDQPAAAEVTLHLARTSAVRGEYARALELLRGAMETREQLGDRAGSAEALDQIGILHGALGHFTDAEADHRRALALHESVGNLEGRLSCLANLAALALARGRWTEAARGAEQAYRLGRELGQPPTVARACLYRGLARVRTGAYDEGHTLLAESIAAARGGGLRRLETGGILGLAELYVGVGAFASALEALGSLLGEARAAADREGEIAALRLTALARARTRAGKSQAAAALPMAEEALALARRIAGRPLVLESLLTLAEVCREAGALADASRAAEDALDLAEELDSEPALAAGLYLHASILSQEDGGVSVTPPLLDRAAALARKTQDRELLWRVLLLRGSLLTEFGGDVDTAGCLREARETLCVLRGKVPGVLGQAFWDFPERRRAAASLGIKA